MRAASCPILPFTAARSSAPLPMKHAYASLLLLLSVAAHAAHVDPETARTIARNFLAGTSLRASDDQPPALDLALRMSSTGADPAAANGAVDYYYVFNAQDATGFVIIAADDAVTPVLAYSDVNAFDAAHLPENMTKWMERYKQAIAAAIALNATADAEVTARWTALQHPASPALDAEDRTVNPLLTTTWDQSPYYNALCPFDAGANQRTVTGCVATAMSQIMKYWSYPATGTGFHSYDHPQYGTLSANFANTTYNWGGMPNSINVNNTAIATLMYTVGVSVEMNYGVAATGGSGAYVISAASPVQHCSEYALRTYFGYDPGMQGVQRENYSDQNWITTLKGELDNSRPILYAGFGGGGGHCFVLDGYDNNNMFHVNWGWSGAYNGYFAVSGMDPAGVGVGGGDGGFNSGQQALINLHPPQGGGQTSDLALYDYVTPSANPIYYGQGFTVTTNIINNAANTFNGDYCAALFDAQGTFVDYVEIISGASLPSGYVYNPPGLTFTSAGSFAYLPGDYQIGIYSRPTGGDWSIVANDGSYTNLIPFQIINPSDIELYSNMDVTTGTPVTQGSAMTVQMNLANYAANDITCDLYLGLFNLDGSNAQDVQQLNGQTMASGFAYGPFTFSTASVDVAPGSYLLALLYYDQAVGAWQLAGSSLYANPIIVNVQAPALLPDIYEADNTYGTAHAFNAVFGGNTANVNTTGSNCHVGTDDDFYSVDLPAGYEYTVHARLHDSYNSGNGQTYTLDALFSWSIDDNTWNGPFDDVMPNDIIVDGPVTLTFHVAPYFQGQTGTYLLNADITRASNVGVAEARTVTIDLSPNPARDLLMVRGVRPGSIVEVRDAQGRRVAVPIAQRTDGAQWLDTHALATGIYHVLVRTDNGTTTRTFVRAE